MEMVLHSQLLAQSEDVASPVPHPINGDSEEQEQDEESRMDTGN